MLKQVPMLALFLLVACCCLEAVLPGGYGDVEVDDEQVLIAAGHATKQLSNRFNSKYHHKLTKILKAEQQVVAGVNYRMDIVLGMTDCKKSEVDIEEVDGCDYQDSVSTYKKCTVIVYRNLKDEHKLTSSGCVLISKNDL